MARPGLMRHKKFARLARLIGNEVLARGHLELLWEVAYENGDDLVGDAGDLEHLAKWGGEPCVLAAAMTQAGFVDLEGEQYRVHDLWDHAPDYVRKRRQRENERQEKGATLRRSADIDRTVTGQSPTDGSSGRRGAPNGRPRAPAPAPSQEAAAALRERAREAPTEGASTGPAPAEVQAPAAAPADDEAPPRRLAVLDLVELGPLGAEVRLGVEEALGVSLAIGPADVPVTFEALVAVQGGPGAVLAWLVPTLLERRHSGGPLPGSVAYLAQMLGDHRAAPSAAVSPGPWDRVVAYAREACGSTSAQLVETLLRLTARFDGDDLVIAGPAAALHEEHHRANFEDLVESALGRPVRLRFEAQGVAAGVA